GEMRVVRKSFEIGPRSTGVAEKEPQQIEVESGNRSENIADGELRLPHMEGKVAAHRQGIEVDQPRDRYKTQRQRVLSPQVREHLLPKATDIGCGRLEAALFDIAPRVADRLARREAV